MEGMDLLGIKAAVPSIHQPTEPSQLSRRELDVLNYIQLGLTNRQIAQKLFVSTNTINKHVRQVLRKLEVSNRVQAAIYAQAAANFRGQLPADQIRMPASQLINAGVYRR
jgi:DNA-binding NarL/FixJ family response regulator